LAGRSTGIAALLILCIGDGVADLVGRKYGSHPLFWSKQKSWEGTLSFILSSFIFSSIWGILFISLGYFQLAITEYLFKLLILITACALAESLPVRDYDNITVFATAVVLGRILWSK